MDSNNSNINNNLNGLNNQNYNPNNQAPVQNFTTPSAPVQNINVEPVQNITQIPTINPSIEQIPQQQVNTAIGNPVQINLDELDNTLDEAMIITDSIANGEQFSENSNVIVKSGGKKEEKKEEGIATHKYPLAILVGFVVIIGLFLVYFFVFMTPKNAFNRTINSFFDDTFSYLLELKTDEHPTTIEAKLNADIKTNYNASLYTQEMEINSLNEIKLANKRKKDPKAELTEEEKKQSDVEAKNYFLSLEKYNNASISVDTLADFDHGNYGLVFGTHNIVSFSNNNSDTIIGDNATKLSLFLKDGKFYLGESKLRANSILDEVLELNEQNTILSVINNLNYEKFKEYKESINKIKDDVLETINVESASRSIKFKKINGHSTLVLQSSIKLNKKDINDIINTVSDNYLKNDTDIIKMLSNATGLSIEKIMDYLKKINEKEYDIKDLRINLYTNILATNLIGMEVIIDNKYIELSSISNEIKFKIERFKEDTSLDFGKLPEDRLFDLDLVYKIENGNLDGYIFYNTDNTGIYSKISFEKEKTTNDLDFNGKLDLKLYYIDNSGKIYEDKPFIELQNTITIKIGKEINLFDKSSDVKTYVTKLKDSSKESISYNTALYNFVGNFNSLFTEFTCYFNTINKYTNYNKHSMAEYKQKNITLYPELIFKSLLKEEYNKKFSNNDTIMDAYSNFIKIGFNKDAALFIENYPEIYNDYSSGIDISSYTLKN